MNRIENTTTGLVTRFLCALFLAFSLHLLGCSNSESVYIGLVEEYTASGNEVNTRYVDSYDQEFPYAGIPKIVIETENAQKITDRETEIPAKFQLWEKNGPASSIVDLTIRGRGNSSWNAPKKSYKIEFSQKQSLLGMPANRDWALISNYADKTLMKNYLTYSLSARLGAYYSPRCEFVELYLNGDYLGVYLLTETIKIGKDRINIPDNSDSYIVEFDGKLRENEQAVRSNVINTNGKTFRIHDPKNASEEALSTIKEHIRSFETFLINMDNADSLSLWIDLAEYVKHYWVQEFSKNPDATFYTSVYFSWVKGGLIKMGPVWDFDLAFGGHGMEHINSTENWQLKDSYWNAYIFKDSTTDQARIDFWKQHREQFVKTIDEADSICSLLQGAAENNFKRWDVLNSTKYIDHRHAYNTYEEAVEDLKDWIRNRIQWIDEQIQ